MQLQRRRGHRVAHRAPAAPGLGQQNVRAHGPVRICQPWAGLGRCEGLVRMALVHLCIGEWAMYTEKTSANYSSPSISARRAIEFRNLLHSRFYENVHALIFQNLLQKHGIVSSAYPAKKTDGADPPTCYCLGSMLV